MSAQSAPASDSRPLALVTGASGGIGGAIVRDLTRTHRVIAVGRDVDALTRLASETGTETQVVELTDAAAVERLAARLDRLDVLVHAAAIADVRSVEQATEDDWERQLRINVISPALLTRATLPLIRRAQGTVIFIGSGSGTRPSAGSAIYTASKFALRAIADVLRLDEQEHRVRVVTVAPGPTDTAMQRTMVAEAGGTYDPEVYIRPESVAREVRHVVDAPADVQITDVAVRPRVEVRRG
ncbi:Oxidoreductase [Microbacterium sp. C448]|uniref:SDR family oxidoreductase n=1 Tax=Microbacterium TaxID=33882 RepID=UPI0003DE4B28|nr:MULTISPECIES: SDR family oxidoreductase [Microbacterium]CDK01420.1 Oxidoreductase [Microbacterium sp. C448]